MSRLFYKINVSEKEMNGTQHVLATSSEFGLWRNLLMDDALSLHQLAGRIKYTEKTVPGFKMPGEKELGFALLRLVQEGLVGMVGQDQGPLIKFKRLHKDAVIPTYSKPGDAGADVSSVQSMLIYPGYTEMLDLGFAIEIEPGWEVQVRSRSGLAKKGIVVSNSPGTIDSGYRGPCKVLLTNTGSKPYRINGPTEDKPGDRIAQFVVKRAPQGRFEEVEELSDSERGQGGFGSTGL